MHLLEREQVLPVSLDQAWEFFSSPRNLNEITPPELGFRIESCEDKPLFDGQIITYRVRLAPLVWVRWVTEIKSVVVRSSFIDEQRAGPYRFWHHRHVFEEVDGGVRMTDTVHYSVGFWFLGEIAHALFVRPKLARIFQFRRDLLSQRFAGR